MKRIIMLILWFSFLLGNYWLYADPYQSNVSSDSSFAADSDNNLFSLPGLAPFQNIEVKQAYDNRDPIAFGIVLSFKDQWPNAEEEEIILAITKKVDLTKTVAVKEPFNWWIFRWPDLRLGEEVSIVCAQFPQEIHELLEFCASDPLLRTEKVVWDTSY